MRQSVFIDSNIWFSAFYKSGTCSELLEKCAQHGTELYVSELVLEEVIKNLKLKLPSTLQYFIEYLKLHDITVLKNPEIFTLRKFESLAHREDLPILVSAIEGSCDFFITGNIKDFNVGKIASEHGLHVLTPAHYLKNG